ncbi:MAG: hypothetical protein AAGD22_02690 [Verrucomicrobiota bacterium]
MKNSLCISIVSILLVFGSAARADFLAYAETRSIAARFKDLAVEHRHDWFAGSDKVIDWRSEGLDIANELFGERNDFSSITIVDGRGDTDELRIPCPPLTYLWISPDEEHIVGLSSIKIWNPVQLVVFARDGTIIHSEHIATEVARLIGPQYHSLIERHPEYAKPLKELALPHFGREPEVFRIRYFDVFDNPDSRISAELFDAMVEFRSFHPYSPNFHGSVTNFVNWYYGSDGIGNESSGSTPRISPVVRLFSDEAFFYLAMRDPEALPFIVSWPKLP